MASAASTTERLLDRRVAAAIGGGELRDSPAPMPTMTASTITFTEATTLPSTFSARTAVLLKRAKGKKMKPASVVSELDQRDE
ncbi:hypothetical protein ABIB94_009062 [Bradyrhizobium sp. JR7.2]